MKKSYLFKRKFIVLTMLTIGFFNAEYSFGQYSIQKVDTLEILKSPSYYDFLRASEYSISGFICPKIEQGFFCKLENKRDPKHKFAYRMRLGTLDYVNKLEHK